MGRENRVTQEREEGYFWVLRHVYYWTSTIPYFLFYPRQALVRCFLHGREGVMISLSGRLLHCYVFTVPILALLGFIARLGGRGLYFFFPSGCSNKQRDKETHTDGQHKIRLPNSQY